ncbi:MAG: hypothetical protein HND56_04680 [Pseudomonadota bacterium]|nr:hypothetical protein [Pseudomonadota bacterium]QKK05027.1 MAG: hypothetical protein HND56_04680 [Pseudomonadota bacterium]
MTEDDTEKPQHKEPHDPPAAKHKKARKKAKKSAARKRSIPHHVVRSTWWFVREALVVAAALSVLVIGFVSWKLSQGPVPLDFATPHLEQAFNDHFPDMSIEVGKTSLLWMPRDAAVILRAHDLRLYDANHTPLMALSKADVEIYKRELPLARIKIKRLTLEDLALNITRTAEGDVRLSFHEKEAEEAAADGAPAATDYSYTLPRDTGKNGAFDAQKLGIFEKLKTLSLKNTDIGFHDQKSDEHWRGSGVDVFLVRGQGTLTGSIKSALTLHNNEDSAPTALNLNFRYDLAENTLGLNLFFKGLNPTSFAGQFSDYPALSMADVLLDGKLDLILDGEFTPVTAKAELYAQEASIRLDQFYKEPKLLRDVKAMLSYDHSLRRAEIEKLFFLFDEHSTVEAEGVLSLPTEENPESGFSANAVLNRLPVDQIRSYWPPSLGTPAHEWVTQHLSKGMAEQATLNLAGTLALGEDNTPVLHSIDRLDGIIDFSDVTVDYLPDLPAVSGVKGRAAYTKDSFDINTSGGKMRDMQIKAGKILISDIGTKKVRIDIATDVAGPLKTAFYALSQKPLQFTRMFAFDMEKSAGKAAVDLTLAFPLKKGLKISDVKVTAKAKLADVAIPAFLNEFGLTGGDFNLSVDNKSMTVDGKGALGKAPMTFVWKNHFSGGDFQHRIQGKIAVPAPMLQSFFHIPPEHLELFFSALPMDFIFTRLKETGSKSTSTLSLAADMTAAEIAIPALRYKKSRDKPGNVSMFIHMDGNRKPQSITSLVVALPGLRAEGNVTLVNKADGSTGISDADIKNFKMGETQFLAEIRQADSALPRIQIKGPYINAASFLPTEKEKAAQKAAPKPGKKQPYEMRIDAARLSLTPEKHIDEVQMYVRKGTDGETEQMEIDGIAGEGRIYYRLFEQDGGHGLTFEAHNAGAALAALGVTQSVRGGHLIIRGVPVQGGGKYDIAGNAELKNFTVVDLPALARLLNAFSPLGLQELLTGDGISFSRMRAYFVWTKRPGPTPLSKPIENIRIKNGRTSGASLGLTFEGDINRSTGEMDINGTIVPAAILNKIVGGIPIIGAILTGGSNAVFAATYTMRGPKDNVAVTVNPLATLAPGILRMILFEEQ